MASSETIDLIWADCAPHDRPCHDQHLEFLTLKTLVEKYCVHPKILKVDCEGCEYDLILNASSDDLQRFTHIQVEYHFGYQNLKIKLEECGFDVTCTKPTYFIPINRNRMTRLVSGDKIVQSNRWTIGSLYATRTL